MGKRIKQTFTPHKGGGEDLSITCKICGEPIMQSNKYGMYCKNKCGEKEDKEAFDKGMNMLGNLFGIKK
jgi:hypothetical protein